MEVYLKISKYGCPTGKSSLLFFLMLFFKSSSTILLHYKILRVFGQSLMYLDLDKFR